MDNRFGVVNRSNGEVSVGDLLWIKLSRGSFWPAVVDDENNVSECRKPGRKKSSGHVLVRIYGSYEYKYVDPIKCRSDFETILKQNNGDCSEIFRKSLEQVLPSEKSARRRGSSSKVPSSGEAASKSDTKRKLTLDSPKSNQTSKKKTPSAPNGVAKDLKRKSTSTDNEPKSKSRTGGGSKKNGVLEDVIDSETEDVINRIVEQVEELNEEALTPLSGKTLLAGCQALSARRMKVMQSLGLSAPSGSPFL